MRPPKNRPAFRPALPGWAAAAAMITGSLQFPGCGGITDTGRAPTSDASTETDAETRDASADGSADASAPIDAGIDPSLDAAGGVCPPLILEDAGTDGEMPPPDVCGGIC